MLQIPRPNWHDRANCTGPIANDTDMFPGPDSVKKYRRAAALCSACPVARECFAEAMEYGEENGIRAGFHFGNLNHRAMANLIAIMML